MRSEVPFIRPSAPAPQDVAAAFASIVDSNIFTNYGPYEQSFAGQLGDYLGDGTRVCTTANGTLALLTALEATLGHGTGDRYVLTPSFTFVAPTQAIIWSGYIPSFVDISPTTWQADVEAAEGLLHDQPGRFAGILLCNAFGTGTPDIDRWEALAASHAIPLIIDSAAGFGSDYVGGAKVGTRGDCEIFSFHATKPFNVGEGGAVASRRADVIDAAVSFSNFGFDTSGSAGALGINAKLSEMSAAIGLQQLRDLDRRLDQRRATYATYRAAMSEHGLTFQPNADRSSLCFASVLCATSRERDVIMESLGHHGVSARNYYNPPVHRHGFLARHDHRMSSSGLPVTDDISSRIVSLPIHDAMAEDDVRRVVEAVVAGARRAVTS